MCPDRCAVRDFISKVPPVTLMFWVIKICATTVGETGGDAFSMSFGLGYAVSSLIFLAFFFVVLAAQVSSTRYHALLYWGVVVATTTVGTTMSDYLDRTLELGYIRSSILLLGGVLIVLFLWRAVIGQIKFENITNRGDEIFYWVTILVSNTLGTALGDFVATDTGLGFERGALIFAGLLALVAAAYFLTNVPKNILFWSAYVLTRPLGATLGDTLTKPHTEGGLDLSRVTSSLVIGAVMLAAILLATARTTNALAPTRQPND
jgi:uncharacterized membrane-anchored protein